MKKILLLDGNSLLYRAFFALPTTMKNLEGSHTNAMYGFLNMFEKVKTKIKPDGIYVMFDLKGGSFRNELYPEYKANRSKMPEELFTQVEPLKDILKAMNICILEKKGFEADDLIGTLSKKISDSGNHAYIVSGDKDTLQLIGDNVTVIYTKKGISTTIEYNQDVLMQDMGLTPSQIIDYKALVGDKSDNIPGIKGIGEKSAMKLLEDYSNLENILENIENISSKSIKTKIQNEAMIGVMSKRLATIDVNVNIDFDINECYDNNPDIEKLLPLLDKYDLNSIKKNYLKDEVIQKSFFDSSTIPDVVTIYSEEELIKEIKKVDDIAIHNYENYLYFYNEKFNNIIKIDSVIVKDCLGSINTNIISYDSKQIYKIFMNNSAKIKNINYDVVLAGYVLDSTVGKYNINYFCKKYLDIELDITSNLTATEVKKYNGNYYYDLMLYELYYSIKIINKLKKMITNQELEKVYYDIELPLAKVLASMEHEGICIDINVLNNLDEEINLSSIEMKIHELAGEEFNINSTKQLGNILFDKLMLPVQKKTKTGYSTNQETLEKLKGKHEIIEYILEYRTLSKLKSTYIDGIKPLIKNGKLHSSFLQTVTTTGRLSSKEPNLQNIPIRMEIGRKIRKMFVPNSKCSTLTGADYSQIELRILAHMSEDESLIKAFNDGIDIHTKTASEVFDKDINEVQSYERSAAKAVNFGIIYGMSDYGLSENLHISVPKAKEYINMYMNRYPSIDILKKSILEFCKEHGYVRTLYGRKRPIPDIYSKNFNLRKYAERTAVNTVIQGTAADIIKIAMINIYNSLSENNMKSKLILQVHDEVIVDTYTGEEKEVENLIRNNMINAANLSVSLSVEINNAENWYELK